MSRGAGLATSWRQLGKMRELVFRYAEILLLLFISVAPYPTTIKMVIYGFLLALNFKRIFECRYTGLEICSLLLMGYSIIKDIALFGDPSGASLASLYYLAPFVLCPAMARKYGDALFSKILENICLFLCLVSLAGYVITVVFPLIIDHFPIVNYYNREVRTVLLFNVLQNGDGNGYLHRNCGVAWEPGAFQFLANLGLVLSFRHTSDKTFSVRAFIYVVTVVTTRSTAGLAICLVVVFASLFRKDVSRSRKSSIGAMLFLLSVPLLGALAFQYEKSSTVGGFEARFANSFFVLSRYLLESDGLLSVLFGMGTNGYDAAYRIDPSVGSWDAYTNLYLRFGVVFVMCFIWMVISVRKIDPGVCIVIAMTLLSEMMVGPISVMYLCLGQNEAARAISPVRSFTNSNACMLQD